MTLDELSYDQRFELKQKYQYEFWEEDPSYEEVANADRYVTDKQLEEAYSGIGFTDGDFSCTSNPVENCLLHSQDITQTQNSRGGLRVKMQK